MECKVDVTSLGSFPIADFAGLNMLFKMQNGQNFIIDYVINKVVNFPFTDSVFRAIGLNKITKILSVIKQNILNFYIIFHLVCIIYCITYLSSKHILINLVTPYLLTYLLTYSLHGAESFMRS